MNIYKTKTLGKLLFKLETRSKAGSGKKLIYLMISYLLPGLFLPFLLLKQNTDHTGFEFTFITYLFYSLIICFTIISELDNLIISPAETEILAALPIDDRLLVRAKLYMLNRYVLVLSIPLFVPGAVNYFYVLGSVPRAIMYFAAGYMLSYFSVNIILLIYSFCLRVLKTKRLGNYTLLFQLMLVLVMIIGYQLISYGITGKGQNTAIGYLHYLQKSGLVDLFPQSWFAFLPSRGHYELTIALPLKVLLPLFICYMSYLSLRMYLDENISVIREKFGSINFSLSSLKPAGASKESTIVKIIDKLYLRNSLERSSFGFMRSMFRAEKSVKLNIIPMIVIPAGLALFALMTNQLPPPIGNTFLMLRPVFHISILFSVLVVINTSIIGMKITNHHGASWIYEAYPVESRKHFKNGIRKFFIIYLLLPVSVIISLIFYLTMPMWQALLQGLFIFTAANLYNSFFNLFSRTLPFTKENTLLNSVQKLTGMVLPFAYGTVIVIVQMFTYGAVESALIALLVLQSVNFWVNFFGFSHIRRTAG